jgi:hypothetical protein
LLLTAIHVKITILFDPISIKRTPVDAPVAATIPNARALALELVSIENRIEEVNRELKALKGRHNQIRMVELPSILNELELTSIGVGNHTITLTTLVDATLSKDPERRTAALDWLHRNGHGGVLKQSLIANLPSGDDVAAMQAITALDDIGLNAYIDRSIHPQTYKALAREIVRSGQVAPMELLGIFVGNIAVVES